MAVCRRLEVSGTWEKCICVKYFKDSRFVYFDRENLGVGPFVYLFSLPKLAAAMIILHNLGLSLEIRPEKRVEPPSSRSDSKMKKSRQPAQQHLKNNEPK